MRINSKEELQSKKAEIEQNIQSFTCRVLVCSGTGCMASGAQKIYDEMVRLCEGIDGVEIEMQKDIPHVLLEAGCIHRPGIQKRFPGFSYPRGPVLR